MEFRQNWMKIKKECRKKGIKQWEDPKFPAIMSSCFQTKTPDKAIKWLRPHEIIHNPKMFSQGASRFDITQGKLGDCWLLASLACLSLHKDLFFRVVPSDQDFSDADYCGCFRFYFWHDGDWTEVVIDDRLPTYRGRLIFVHSRDSDEFWSALVEKAYAKLFGCYEALMGGSLEEGLADFTGGITEQVELTGDPSQLYRLLHKAYDRNSLMGCSIPAGSRAEIESKQDNGLVKGHAYSITGLVELKRKRGRMQELVRLIRVRNPWGQREWNGAWCDSSEEWNTISARDRKQLEIVSSEDGEFWMAFEDFCREFANVAICHREPEEEVNNRRASSVEKTWFVERFESRWDASSAGGCRNFPETFHYNPQFRTQLVDVDEEDDDDLCTLVVSLLQCDTRGLGKEKHCIGISVYKIDKGAPSTLDYEYIMYHKQVARSKTFSDSRETVLRTKLPPGEYCIIPSTFESKKHGSFLMRIFTEQRVKSKEVDDETSGSIQFQRYNFTPSELKTAEDMADAFDELAGNSGHLGVWKIQPLLNRMALFKEIHQTQYSLEACRSLVCTFDRNGSGVLEYEELVEVYRFLSMLKKVFVNHDEDKSGTLAAFELKSAVRSMGASLSRKIISRLVTRYAGKDGTISFDDFVAIAAKVCSALDACNEFGLEADSVVQITKNQIINFALYI